MEKFDERMLDRDLEEVLGNDNPSDLTGRILAAQGKPSAPRRTGRLHRRTQVFPTGRTSRQTAFWGAGIAALCLLALAVVTWSYLATQSVPSRPDPEVAGKPANLAPVINAPAAKPSDAAPKPMPDIPEPLPDQPVQPTPPSPVPKAPEEPAPLPVPPPEVPKPDGEVEKPSPKAPETPDDTGPPTALGEKPQNVATVLSVPKGAKLQLRYSLTESWREAGSEPLHSGALLKASRAIDLTLVGGGLLRFEGSLALNALVGATGIELLERKTLVYCDNLGCASPLIVGQRNVKAGLSDGAATFEANSLSLDVCCFQGEISAGNERLKPGQFANLGEKGWGKMRESTALERAPRFMQGMAARKLVREDFEAEPAGKLYSGRVEAGSAFAEGNGAMLAFDFKPSLVSVPGAIFRMRYRVTGADNIYPQFLGDDVTRQYGKHLDQAKAKSGQWQELELRLDGLEFDADTSGGPKMPAGLALGKFQCYVRGSKDCKLEIDWLEVVRVVD